jgi:hypothetical protein
MFRTAVLTIVLALAAGPTALAQLPPQPPPVQNPMTQGTEQERAACHPDVVKYCQAELRKDENDVFAILGCLQTNRARISTACNNVLKGHGQ